MTTIVTVLTEGFADWETALLNAAARAFYKMETMYAAPGGKPVTSSGGMRVMPDMALEKIDVDALDALIICGGTAWQTPGAPDISGLARSAAKRGKIIGAICDGTVALAKTGLLDGIAHTSNGDGYLDETGYKGKALYRNVPYAVTDGRIVTAPGTAPVSFMSEIMKLIGLGDANLDYYVGLHAAQFKRAA